MASNFHRASYRTQVVGDFLLLVDLDLGKSITNDAENVIADLVRDGALADGKRVLYRDTLGRWDELLHDGMRFTGFRAINGLTGDDAIRRAVQTNPKEG